MTLRPQSNQVRTCLTLDGLWEFRPDPDQQGEREGWQDGLTATRPIAVPASWNEQYSDLLYFFGTGWYQADFTYPPAPVGQPAALRIGSAFYRCKVWLNGALLGEHEGGHLPFTLDITPHLAVQNRLVIQVNGELGPNTVPPACVPPDPLDTFSSENASYPPVNFDFFPYAGLHRPVQISLLPEHHLTDLTIVTEPADKGSVRVTVTAQRNDDQPLTLRLSLCGQTREVVSHATTEHLTFDLRSPALWSPQSPALHELRAELYHSDRLVDEYKLNVGLRWVEVRDGHLLLNGEPVFLRGFNKHEDFPILGKGLCHPLNIRDYDLMHWCGANSYRTSHYPYAEEMMDLADRLGFLVIDEIPAVGLWFGEGWERRLELCMQQITELVDRDKNHPGVIMWSVANEPHSRRPAAKEFFRHLIERARSLDSTRPVTLVSAVGLAEEALEYCDVACINRYYGWYSECGQIERGVVKLEEDLRAIHQRYGKPIILSEFGADAVHGLHTQPAEMFSEEYQAQMLERYLDVTDRLPFVIGQHIWNFADFKTGQNITRVGALNRKGVFTRDRQPKMAAHMLRRRWTS